jgi:hypothetical protein
MTSSQLWLYHGQLKLDDIHVTNNRGILNWFWYCYCSMPTMVLVQGDKEVDENCHLLLPCECVLTLDCMTTNLYQSSLLVPQKDFRNNFLHDSLISFSELGYTISTSQPLPLLRAPPVFGFMLLYITLILPRDHDHPTRQPTSWCPLLPMTYFFRGATGFPIIYYFNFWKNCLSAMIAMVLFSLACPLS